MGTVTFKLQKEFIAEFIPVPYEDYLIDIVEYLEFIIKEKQQDSK